MHFAAANPQVQPQVIAFLIERGCTDVNLRTRAGETVIGLYLERALEFQPEIINTLVKAGLRKEGLDPEVISMFKQLGL